jgi:enoyl-CoA hydratase|tara:strand:- start:418 stop:1194 length:777 start_codon:yes stop_codon:yes gene_type:complete
MAYETLIIEHEEPILIIRLNRPNALNALNSKLLEELNSALTDADSNDAVRTIILTGTEKAFAAGADIKEMISKNFVDMFYKNFFSNDLDRIQSTRKPIIAAVAGYALGGGCELAMRCDFILAADSAKFGQPEINLGVMAGFGGTQLLSKFVGKSKAMEMHLTGRNMDAEEAERAGLVSRVVPAEDLLKEAKAVAYKIAEKSMLSTMGIKESINRSFEIGMSEGVLFERRIFNALFSTDDKKEGMSAFIEKRKPKFEDK